MSDFFYPDSVSIIEKYFDPSGLAYHYLIKHSKAVTEKALEIAANNKHLKPDVDFIYAAAMLHDIGIILTNAPSIGCFGEARYIQHGFIGRIILENEGFPELALVCERHIGVGISKDDILKQGLDLPLRDMLPLSVEEKIICVADKFFSKTPEYLENPKPLTLIRSEIKKYGDDKLLQLDAMLSVFRITQ